MPIRVKMHALYPFDWPQLPRTVGFRRVGWRREQCGRPYRSGPVQLGDCSGWDEAVGAWRCERGHRQLLLPPLARLVARPATTLATVATIAPQWSAPWPDPLPAPPSALPWRLRWVVLSAAQRNHDSTDKHGADLAAVCGRCCLAQDRHRHQRRVRLTLRGLVRALAPQRGVRDLIGLADRTLLALGQCSRPDWSHHRDRIGSPTIVITPAEPGLPDVGDLAMALPYALRRAGFARNVLPSVTGRPKLLGRDKEPSALFMAWLSAITRQVEDTHARLRLLERHLAFVTRALAGVRRPAALQRTVAVSLARWGIWAAQLARITGTDLSTAFRSLEQAAQLGLVVEVPQQRRGRGTRPSMQRHPG